MNRGVKWLGCGTNQVLPGKKQKSQSTLDFYMSKMNTAQAWVNIRMVNKGLREDNNSNNSPSY